MEVPELPVAEAPSPSEAVGKLDGGEVPGEGIIPRGGALDGLTREALRADVQKKAQDMEREYAKAGDDFIKNNDRNEIRQERNRMDNAVGQWTSGYRAAKEILDAKLKRHEGKQLDGLPQEEQQDIKKLIQNINNHAIQIRALQKLVEQYDKHLDDAPIDADGAKRVNDRNVVGIKKGKPSRFNKNHGHVEIDGILVPQAVKKGNRNISVQTEADQFVKDGGDLDDVPDVFLKGAILAKANYPDEPPGQIRRRFKLSADPGNGINNRAARTKEDKTYVAEDAVSGKRYILKSPSFVENEFIGEQYAAVLGQAFGRPLSRVRIAGDIVSIQGDQSVTRNPSILVEHYGDVVDGMLVSRDTSKFLFPKICKKRINTRNY